MITDTPTLRHSDTISDFRAGCGLSSAEAGQETAARVETGSMVLEENSSPPSPGGVVHETNAGVRAAEFSTGGNRESRELSASSALSCSTLVSEAQATRYAARLKLWHEWQELQQGDPALGLEKAAEILGTSAPTLCRMRQQVQSKGLDGLKDLCHLRGRKARLTLTFAEEKRLQELYLRTNRTRDAGSMQTACKFFALDPQTEEEIRCAILADIEKGRVPKFCDRALKKVTRAHVGAHRKPDLLATEHFAGSVGANAQDKFDRRRVVESDDGTLNFAAWIPWAQGGDPCSDRFGVRIGRWQFLPAMECGWSHFYLGYSLIARPRGSYTQEDVRSVISMVTHDHGLPDTFRFERGTWESNSVVELLQRLGVELETVYQPNQKPFIEGGFSKLWTYLSVIDGQLGRYRGDMETEGRQYEACRTGRHDPRKYFPALDQCISALDGAMAMHNSDTIKSVYGSWVPEVRHKQLGEERPWRQLPDEMEFLFAPWVKEWTVAKGTVGNKVRLLPDLETPCYFTHEELWRWNGRKVRVYFDPTQERVEATIVSLVDYAGYKPGDIICQAELFGALPHFARAAVGWTSGTCAKTHASHRGPLSEVRREVRALGARGQIVSATSELRDGRGNGLKAATGKESSTGESRESRSSAVSAASCSSSRVTFDEDDFSALGTEDCGLAARNGARGRGDNASPGALSEFD